MSLSTTTSVLNYNLEFKCTTDDAWYNCAVILDTHTNHLIVKFQDFIQSYNDELFSPSHFSTTHQLESFIHRFRPVSKSVDHRHCSKVTQGLTVCAAYDRDGQYRYFDAFVDAVCYKEHKLGKCLCMYLLNWQHGPEEGNLTTANLNDIYLIQSGSVDPTLAYFTKLVKQKIKQASFEFFLIPKNPVLARKTSSDESITKPQVGIARQSSPVGFFAGRGRSFLNIRDEDRDLGGEKETSSDHYIILENVENDLCPIMMMDFIYEETLITTRAYVFPSILGGTYARGAILVDSKTQLKRIYEFINNPKHFIVSSSGRPWVIAEDKLRTGLFNKSMDSLQPKHENDKRKNVLKVVRLGTEEYTKAKELKELYFEFRNHLNGLLQRLATEEEKNNQISS